MSQINTEAKARLLKDLAENIGYTLISAPFETPFVEESLKDIECPDNKRLIWPVPVSNLCDEFHEEFRKQWINADLIDTVAELSISWPSNEDEHTAILLIDFNRNRRGAIKFVDATMWNDLDDDDNMAAVCNMLIHDIFPGESHLTFCMDEDIMDEQLDEPWNEMVIITGIININNTLLPTKYIPKTQPKEGFKFLDIEVKEMFGPASNTDLQKVKDILKSSGLLTEGKIKGKILRLDNLKSSSLNYWIKNEDIDEDEYDGEYYELNGNAIVISKIDNMNPTIVETKGETIYIPLGNMSVIEPNEEFDLEYVAWELRKDYIKSQLPFIKGNIDFYKIRIEVPINGGIMEQRRIVAKERQELIDFYKSELSGI